MLPEADQTDRRGGQRVAPADRRVVGGRGPLVPAQRGVLGQKAPAQQDRGGQHVLRDRVLVVERVGHHRAGRQRGDVDPVHAGAGACTSRRVLPAAPIAGVHRPLTSTSASDQGGLDGTVVPSVRPAHLGADRQACRQLGAQRRQFGSVTTIFMRCLSTAESLNCGGLSSPVSGRRGASPRRCVSRAGADRAGGGPDDQVGGAAAGCAAAGRSPEAGGPSSSRLSARPGRSGSRCWSGRAVRRRRTGCRRCRPPKGPRDPDAERAGRRRSRRGPPGRCARSRR